MKQSIQRKLPLFVTALLLAVTIAQLTIGYGEVRQASRALADKRLQLADSADTAEEVLHEVRRRMKRLRPELHALYMRRATVTRGS